MSYANYTPDEVVDRGEAIYAAKIRGQMTEADTGKFVIVDIDSGEYEIDVSELAAMKRALEKRPRSIVYSLRVGYPAAHRIGSVTASATSR